MMKLLELTAFGHDYKDLIESLEHAIAMLKLGTPSENIVWKNKTSVEFNVRDCDVEEFIQETGYEEEE